MIEIKSEKKVVTYQEIHVHEDYDLEANQKVVDLHGTKWYAQYAYISENWDVTDGAPKERSVFVNVSLISVLKNGKAGNAYKNFFVGSTSNSKKLFQHLFDAYEQELAKVTQEVAVA